MDLVTQISAGRIAIGVAALARPDLAARVLAPGAPSAGPVYLTRLAGARDLALGVATLLAPRGARKALLGIGLAVDASDAYAGYEAYRSGSMPAAAGMVVTGAAVAAVLAGAVGLTEKPAAIAS